MCKKDRTVVGRGSNCSLIARDSARRSLRTHSQNMGAPSGQRIAITHTLAVQHLPP